MMRVCLIAHDAGGAEVVAAWARHHSEHHYTIFVGGPAVSVFTHRLGLQNFYPLEEALDSLKRERFDLLMTSLSWGTTVERQSWTTAKERGIPSVSYLDGWADFSNGFQLDGKRVEPNEVWVTNEVSFEHVCHLGFNRERVRIEPNLYLVDIQERALLREREMKLALDAGQHRILYICENISDCERTFHFNHAKRGYDELDALELFFTKLQQQTFGKPERVRIRPHPSETSEKYASILKKYEKFLPTVSPKGVPLEEDIAWAETVVGCESVALIVAALCKKTVYSCIPKSAHYPCRLPHREILKIVA